LCPKCVKTHLRASVNSKFFRGLYPRTPAERGRGGGEEKGRAGKKGRGEGRGREGREEVCCPNNACLSTPLKEHFSSMNDRIIECAFIHANQSRKFIATTGNGTGNSELTHARTNARNILNLNTYLEFKYVFKKQILK
jgi:hypothetical protein